MPSTAVGFIANSSLPLEANSVEISPDGEIRRLSPESVNFSFEYYGIRFVADATFGDDKGHLHISGDLGPIPYTQQSAEGRQAILTVMTAAAEYEGVLIRTSDRQHILVEAAIDIERPLTDRKLLTASTVFLAIATPFLDVLGRVIEESALPEAVSA